MIKASKDGHFLLTEIDYDGFFFIANIYAPNTHE